ncbi:MAG: FHA domain-containing protein [Armatimonadetes bacterium]|nr:FHA domain-containing protein [Armatimonadota bacterium]
MLSPIALIACPTEWALFGCVLSSSQGIARGSMKGAKRTAFGGGLGGLSFEVLQMSTNLPDSVCRGIAVVLIGALIGTFASLFERLFALATIKIASGKLEGKEFILDKLVVIIGRDERCDIPIYYDRAVLPQHVRL